jgi:cysteine-rich repeat protein
MSSSSASSEASTSSASSAGSEASASGESSSFFIDFLLCGNYSLDPGEQCDDANRRSGDGCSTECQIEPGYVPACGDGILSIGEQCDDNNHIDIDGCNNQCRLSPSLLLSACGDFSLAPAEECDDGNIKDDDFCSATCTIEPGYEPRVGDGILTQGEECDDGNTRDGDGCNSQGLLENGSCGDGIVQHLLDEQCEQAIHDPKLPYKCGDDCRYLSLFCGNGDLDPGEQCDEGPRNSSLLPDHCRANCSAFRCGDSVLDAAEQCDDGNRIPGDGCDRFCRSEHGVASDVIYLLGGEIGGGGAGGAGGGSAETPTTASSILDISAAHPPAGQTGPAALAVLAAGAAAGYAWVRRRMK